MAVRGPATQNEITKVVMTFPGMMQLHETHEQEISFLKAELATMKSKVEVLEVLVQELKLQTTLETRIQPVLTPTEAVLTKEEVNMILGIDTSSVVEETTTISDEVESLDETPAETKTIRKRKTKTEGKEE